MSPLEPFRLTMTSFTETYSIVQKRTKWERNITMETTETSIVFYLSYFFHFSFFNYVCTVGIQIPELSAIPNVKSSLVVNCLEWEQPGYYLKSLLSPDFKWFRFDYSLKKKLVYFGNLNTKHFSFWIINRFLSGLVQNGRHFVKQL